MARCPSGSMPVSLGPKGHSREAPLQTSSKHACYQTPHVGLSCAIGFIGRVPGKLPQSTHLHKLRHWSVVPSLCRGSRGCAFRIEGMHLRASAATWTPHSFKKNVAKLYQAPCARRQYAWRIQAFPTKICGFGTPKNPASFSR